MSKTSTIKSERFIHPDDPMPRVPYEQRTIAQLIYTFEQVNEGWVMFTQWIGGSVDDARFYLRLCASKLGYGLDDVPTREDAYRLSNALGNMCMDPRTHKAGGVQ
ncbi:hypothetical protein [Microbacterium rhizomatis]|uniref:Uncharacterized protein n=1 Tax=Microbacterium rhizomatis TaxID=1631477 RepID=A0A5J5J2F3_9MICO|nr:hypothetical protein [Microbacterium rhizomatis]KAA9110377.1 hypothetical protein F6B43_01395 [Microbacterium rhizomatis]